MALTTIDAKPALVVIDLQKGMTALPTVHPFDEIVQQAASLATAFRRHGLPVMLVNVTGRAPGRTEAGQSGYTPPPDPDWADPVEELQPAHNWFRAVPGGRSGAAASSWSHRAARNHPFSW